MSLLTNNIDKWLTRATLTKRSSDAVISGSPAALDTTVIIKAFVQPISGAETFQDGRAGESATHRAYVLENVKAEYTDILTQDGQDYIVLYSIQPAGVSGKVHAMARGKMSINTRPTHKEYILSIFDNKAGM